VRAICAWCRAEGTPADLGEREPLERPDETHGFCERHFAEFLATARSRPPARLRLLVVVKSGDPSLYEYLTRTMAPVAGVHVIVERRHGERRRETHPISGERRQVDRRQARGVVHSIGCTFVRFNPAYGASRAS
jgi:hypothetical protein